VVPEALRSLCTEINHRLDSFSTNNLHGVARAALAHVRAKRLHEATMRIVVYTTSRIFRRGENAVFGGVTERSEGTEVSKHRSGEVARYRLLYHAGHLGPNPKSRIRGWGYKWSRLHRAHRLVPRYLIRYSSAPPLSPVRHAVFQSNTYVTDRQTVTGEFNSSERIWLSSTDL
jgi:hypothetical protein